MVRGLGVTQLDAQSDALIAKLEQLIEDVKKYKENTRKLLRVTSEDTEIEQQDQEMIKEFIHEKFVSSRPDVEETFALVKRDPKIWLDLLNPLLYSPIRAPTLLGSIRREYKKIRDK